MIKRLSKADERKLLAWYNSQDKSSKLKKMVDFVTPEIWMMMPMLWLMSRAQMTPDSFRANVLTFLFFISSFVAGLRCFYEAIRKFKRLTSEYETLPKKGFKKIYADVDRIAKRMKIKGKISIRFDNSIRSSPHMYNDWWGESIHLVLPRNLILLQKRDRAAFHAIIAHELGHVLQEDTYLWFVSRVNQISFTIWQTVFIIAIFVAEADFGDSTLLLVYLSWPIWRRAASSNMYRSSRKRSELRADIASIIYAKNFKIVEVLSRGNEENNKKEYHPTPTERIQNIVKILHQNEIAYPQELVSPYLIEPA